MRRTELKELRQLLEDKINERKAINSLLDSGLIKEYLRIKKIDDSKLDTENIREVLKEILDSYKISKTNGIYVCTKAYYYDPHVVYQDLVCTTVDVDIDSKCAERRIYYDIESCALERAFKEENNFYPTFREFEDFNIVLNPYNTSKDKNGYEEVRMDFFENSIKYGQSKSKKLLLSKYKKL